MWWYRALHRRLVAALAGLDGYVLDAGCGTGGLLARLLAERPDLHAVGLEWAEAASRRAADEVRRARRAWQRQCAAICAGMLRCRDRRRSALPWRGRPGAGAGGIAAGAAAGRPADRQHAGLCMAAVRSRSPGAQRATRHAGASSRALLRGAGFVRVNATYWNGSAAAAHGGAAQAAGAAMWPPPTLPRFRHGSMPRFMPSQRSNAACPFACRPAGRCWRPRSGHERRHRPALPPVPLPRTVSVGSRPVDRHSGVSRCLDN